MLSPDKVQAKHNEAVEKELHIEIVRKREEALKREIEQSELKRKKQQSIQKIKDCKAMLAYECKPNLFYQTFLTNFVSTGFLIKKTH